VLRIYVYECVYDFIHVLYTYIDIYIVYICILNACIAQKNLEDEDVEIIILPHKQPKVK
jgi:hypothetical protein